LESQGLVEESCFSVHKDTQGKAMIKLWTLQCEWPKHHSNLCQSEQCWFSKPKPQRWILALGAAVSPGFV
jgi:hypothetical protein